MKQQIRYLSYLRAVSAVAVVILHSFYAAVQNFQPELFDRTVCMAVRNSMLFAVPVFAMVTGALLLDPAHDVTIKKILLVYVRRVISALVIFSIIYQIFDKWYQKEVFHVNAIPAFFRNLYTGENWGHMWYLYLLIGLYLLLPVYRKVVVERELVIYFLIIHFIFLSVLPFIKTISGLESAFFICVYTIYPLYFVMGYAFHSEIIRISGAVGTLMALGSMIGIIGFTIYGYRNNNEAVLSLLNSYSFVLVILEAVGVFALCRTIAANETTSAIGRILLALDRNSFGNYLIHMILLKLLYAVLKIDPFGALYGFKIMIIAIAVTIAAALITMIFKKIPFVKKIL